MTLDCVIAPVVMATNSPMIWASCAAAEFKLAASKSVCKRSNLFPVKEKLLATPPIIEINPRLDIQIEEIGDGYSYVLIDDFLQNPEELVQFAFDNAAQFSVPEGSYPGLLFDVDDQAVPNLRRFIRSEMGRQFAFMKGDAKMSTFLSMVTAQPSELSNLQRLCHSDPQTDVGRQNFAAIVYLFDDEALGGTGFYRWKEQKLIEEATALEQQNPEKALTFLREHFETYRQPACYMTESSEIAERLHTIPARFNRFVFYSGNLPHSASIAKPELLSNDFRSGRLTLNCFASVRPR